MIEWEVTEMEGKKGFIARMKQGKLDKTFDISIHPEGGGNGLPVNFPLHWHEYYEVEILLTGHATEYVNDKIIEKSKGSFSILSPSACHAVELDGDALLVNIRMRERFFNGYEEIRRKIELPGGAISGILPPKDFEKLIFICQIIREDFEQTNLLSEANRNLVFYLLHKLMENTESRSQNKSGEKQMSDILYYINHNFTQKLTVESTAKVFGFASNYFGKMFFQRAGISFNDYVNNVRLNYGYSLVIENEQSIEEIATACGFGDRTYFATKFRRQFGMTPTECREKNAAKRANAAPKG